MFSSSSTLFKLLVWLFCVGAMGLVSEVQCRTLEGNERPETLTGGLGRLCGVEDNISSRKRRDTRIYRWPAGSTLTYRVGRGPTHGVLKDVYFDGLVKLAFEEWAPHCGLHFTQIHSGEANINITFEKLANWLYKPSSGPAAAYTSGYPSEKNQKLQVYFDDGLEWTLFATSGRFQFYAILLHELGHALGLQHNASKRSVMYYSTDPYGHETTYTLPDVDKMQMRKNYDIAGTYSRTSIYTLSLRVILFHLLTGIVN